MHPQKGAALLTQRKDNGKTVQEWSVVICTVLGQNNSAVNKKKRPLNLYFKDIFTA